MLNEFFAVTMTSIYRVFMDEHGCARAVKIVRKGVSAVAVGEELKRGTMIAICKALIAYVPEGGGLSSYERRIQWVNIRYWGGNSSLIVALFASETDARACLSSHRLKPDDARWRRETAAVLEAIGDDHPGFFVERDPRFGLSAAAK